MSKKEDVLKSFRFLKGGIVSKIIVNDKLYE